MSAETARVAPGLPVLVCTELLKLGTTRAPWVVAAGALVLTTLLALQPVTRAGRDGAPSIGTAGAALGVIDAALREGPRRRVAALRLPGLHRQTWQETLLFRVWFMMG